MKGVPRGFEISVDKIKNELRRRRVGVGRSERQLSETDEIIFLNGLDNGVTTGAVLRFFIPNAVEVASDGTKPITAIRSGHADLAGCVKLGLENARPVCEEASARNTVVYTAAGAICRQILEKKRFKLFFPMRRK